MRRLLHHLWSIFGSMRTEVTLRGSQIDALERDAKRAVHAIDEQIDIMRGRQ